MTQARKRAVFGLIIWGVVAVGFLFVFFSADGPEGYHQNRPRKLITGLLFLVGFLSYFSMYFLTRREGAGLIARDERDERNDRKASTATLTVVLLYVYVSSITLWTIFEGSGVVPVGWMWFQAYFTALVGILTNSAASLIMDSRSGGYAES